MSRGSRIALILLLACVAAPMEASETLRRPLPANVDPALDRLLEEVGPGGEIKVWVLFRRDKGYRTPAEKETALAALQRTYNPHAIRRRISRRTRPGLFDIDDLPIPEPWIAGVRAAGARIVVRSRWVCGVSAWADRDQITAIASFPYVTEIRPVARGRRREPLVPDEAPGRSLATSDGSVTGFYGEAEQQLGQINLIALHGLGYTGDGMRIGILDSGFRRTHAAFNEPGHPLDVITEWDFVNDDPQTAPEIGDAYNQHEHGTAILGAIAAYQPDVLIGSAPDASYILAKVEDVSSEYPLEEDWFAAGLEFIEQNGGDLATSSVTIYDHYTQEQMDGKTSVMARAVNTATDNGLHVCQGAGNSGHDDDPATSSLVPPADAFKVIAVGSVDVNNDLAWFTSDGPTADGRLKPELMARGVNTRTVSVWFDTGTDGYDGASMATPLVCGAAACLLGAHPDWSIDQLRTHLFLHGDYYLSTGAPDPLFVQGFGIPDVMAAYGQDCNDNGVEDPADLEEGTSGDCNGNAIPDECDVAALTSADEIEDGLPDECTECSVGPGCPDEVENLRLNKSYPDLILTWEASSASVEYSVRKDETAPGAGTTEVARTPLLSWTDEGAMSTPPDLAFYLVRGVTAGGVVGP